MKKAAISFLWIPLESRSRMFNLSCFNTTSNFIMISWKVCKKMQPTSFAFHWTCDLQPRSRSLKCYKMVGVNGACVHGIYERIWFWSFACDVQCQSYCCTERTNNGWLGKHNWSHRSICYSYGSKTTGCKPMICFVKSCKPKSSPIINKRVKKI